jgi:hypothetical protein
MGAGKQYGPELDNANLFYDAESTGGSKRTHFCFANTFVTAASITPGARSYSLCNSAAVTARSLLGRASTSSCLQRRRARVIHTPCANTSSRSTHSSPAISNYGASRGAGAVGFGAFRVVDGAAERRWMWMIGEAVEGGRDLRSGSRRAPSG